MDFLRVLWDLPMHRHIILVVSGLLLLGPTIFPIGADDRDKALTDRPTVARMFSPVGTILIREPAQQRWKLPQLFDDIRAGDRLLTLPGARGIVDLKEGDVRLTLAGNLPELSPSPVLESALVIREGPDSDVALTLERGRIILENRRENTPAKIGLKSGSMSADLTLAGKGAALVVEALGECPPGTPFSLEPGKAVAPDRSLVFLVIKGRAEVAFTGVRHTLAGPSRLRWSSRQGVNGPTQLREVPEWLKPSPDVSARISAWHKAVEDIRRRVADKQSVTAGVAAACKSANPFIRTVAAFSAGSIGDVDRVLAALSDAKAAEVRRAAIVALRQLIGLGTKEDVMIYKAVLKAPLRAGEAQIVMQLLHAFGEQQKSRPETYKSLLDRLQHEKLAVRELASWNLSRLVPEGNRIAYDAASSEDERGRAQAEWRKLLAGRNLAGP